MARHPPRWRDYDDVLSEVVNFGLVGQGLAEQPGAGPSTRDDRCAVLGPVGLEEHNLRDVSTSASRFRLPVASGTS